MPRDLDSCFTSDVSIDLTVLKYKLKTNLILTIF